MPPMPPMPQPTVIKGLATEGRNSSYGLMETEPPPFIFAPEEIETIQRAMRALAEPDGRNQSSNGELCLDDHSGVSSTVEPTLGGRKLSEMALNGERAMHTGRMGFNGELILDDLGITKKESHRWPEPVDRLAAIMADPILSDPRWHDPIRPAPAPILSDDDWASTLEQEARCRHRASAAKIGARS
jgi:hypothetical protein